MVLQEPIWDKLENKLGSSRGQSLPFHDALRRYQLVGAAEKLFCFPRVATIVYVAVCSLATYIQSSAYRDLLNNS